MRNYNNEVVGAVQLINAKRRFDTKLTIDSVAAEVISFRPEDLEMNRVDRQPGRGGQSTTRTCWTRSRPCSTVS